ncbi:hypothetical protein CVS40_11835, partial [Lucilia cuprina]
HFPRTFHTFLLVSKTLVLQPKAFPEGLILRRRRHDCGRSLPRRRFCAWRFRR